MNCPLLLPRPFSDGYSALCLVLSLSNFRDSFGKESAEKFSMINEKIDNALGLSKPWDIKGSLKD
jgi:hypothetical protein